MRVVSPCETRVHVRGRPASVKFFHAPTNIPYAARHERRRLAGSGPPGSISWLDQWKVEHFTTIAVVVARQKEAVATAVYKPAS